MIELIQHSDLKKKITHGLFLLQTLLICKFGWLNILKVQFSIQQQQQQHNGVKSAYLNMADTA